MRKIFMLFLTLPMTIVLIGQDKCNCETLDTIKTTGAYLHYKDSQDVLCKIHFLVENFNSNIKKQEYQEAENQILKAIDQLKKINSKKRTKVHYLKK